MALDRPLLLWTRSDAAALTHSLPLVTPPLRDEQLMRWAREHLVYEGRMLGYTAVRLAERQGIPRGPESNSLLESFVVHVRCLRDFLWGTRKPYQPMDAFAVDFCEAGVWEGERGSLTLGLAEIDKLQRTGREVVHLSYHRLAMDVASKDWDVGEIYMELADALSRFTAVALPSRLDAETCAALKNLSSHNENVGPASVATGALYGIAIRGGTIAFPGFHAGS